MCADCHSTNVKKGFTAATNSYATTWSELNVSCEACHGPGSAHVAWAEAVKAGKAKKDDADKGLAVTLNDHDKATWEFDMKTGIAKRSVPRTSHAVVETCARCHARRSVVAADYVFGQPLLQTYRPALLTEGLYFADGQIQDEVYEYGSFLQSKMHAAGVTCTNCHNAHDLKVPVSADRVCAACHLPEKFDTPAHTFHKAGSTGSRCVSCHMPTRDYMVVHARHDHSFRAPRPDLSVSIGTPNACTQCHRNKSNAWAAEAALRWWGDKVRAEPHYGQVIHAAREEQASAEPALQQLVGDVDPAWNPPRDGRVDARARRRRDVHGRALSCAGRSRPARARGGADGRRDDRPGGAASPRVAAPARPRSDGAHRCRADARLRSEGADELLRARRLRGGARGIRAVPDGRRGPRGGAPEPRGRLRGAGRARSRRSRVQDRPRAHAGPRPGPTSTSRTSTARRAATTRGSASCARASRGRRRIPASTTRSGWPWFARGRWARP